VKLVKNELQPGTFSVSFCRCPIAQFTVCHVRAGCLPCLIRHTLVSSLTQTLPLSLSCSISPSPYLSHVTHNFEQGSTLEIQVRFQTPAGEDTLVRPPHVTKGDTVIISAVNTQCAPPDDYTVLRALLLERDTHTPTLVGVGEAADALRRVGAQMSKCTGRLRLELCLISVMVFIFRPVK
jgi:hypothetical protein